LRCKGQLRKGKISLRKNWVGEQPQEATNQPKWLGKE
jgi:hypothetical protein